MIIITGCAGFIGFHLSKKLLEKNQKIIGIDNLNNYYNQKLKQNRLKILKAYKNFKFFKIDLKNKDVLFKKIKKKKNYSALIHLAAQPGVRISIEKPHNTLVENLNSFSNIVELVRVCKIKKFLYASSSSVYGKTQKFPFDESDKNNIPVSVYGSTKLCNELIAETYVRNFKIKAIGMRFFTVYGPYGRPDMAYYSFMDNLIKSKKITVFNKGQMLRDFTYIEDIVLGIYKLLKKSVKLDHCIVNLGKGKPDKLFSLIDNIQKYSGKKFKLNFTKTIPNGDIKKTYASVKKVKKLINWRPKTNLDQGISNFIKWYKDYHE